MQLGIVCAIGACFGLIVSMAYGLHPLLTPLVGGLASLCVWAPKEVFRFAFAAVTLRWVGPTARVLGNIARKAWDTREEFVQAICCAVYVFLAMTLVLVAGCTLYVSLLFVGWDVDAEGKGFPRILLLLMYSFIIGIGFEAFWRSMKTSTRPHFPVTRRLPLALSVLRWPGVKEGDQKKWHEYSPMQRLAFVSWAFFIPLMGVVGAIIGMIDGILTLLILSARTKTLAAFTGGAMGAAAGEFFRHSGLAPDVEPIVVLGVGAIAGFCSGPAFHYVMNALAAPTETHDIIALPK